MKYIPAADVIVRKETQVVLTVEWSWDTAVVGRITDINPIDPDGNTYAEGVEGYGNDLVEVTWPDGEIEFLTRGELSVVV